MLNNSNIIDYTPNEVDVDVEDKTIEKDVSICIPRVFKHISNEFIIDIFQNKLQLGLVKRVDVIFGSNNKGSNSNSNSNSNNNNVNNVFKKVFIHFEHWYDNTKANSVKNKLLDDITIKIVYDSPWFWKCVLNKSVEYSRNTHTIGRDKKQT